jgi:hypothetical protein
VAPAVARAAPAPAAPAAARAAPAPAAPATARAAPAPAAKKKPAKAKPVARRVVMPEPDDVDAGDDDEVFDYRRQSSGFLEGVDRKWLFGGAAAVLLLLFFAWPSGKKAPKAARKEVEIAKPVEKPSIKVQAYLRETPAAAMQPMKIKLAANYATPTPRPRVDRAPAKAERPSEDTDSSSDNPVLPPDEREISAGAAERALQESE